MELGRDVNGEVWLTIREAAAFTRRRLETIYSWERRGLLTEPRHDEHGRRIYRQQQIADVEKAVRPRAARILGRQAA
ncbi:MerR family transcriptional regulator [Streptomyces sp. NPDC127040]|uniref:MerR family transcriptional regulator n=1 Tax=Streptomyces sp. NPDC127040 TaxID=3347116 RepID=UPI00365DFC00